MNSAVKEIPNFTGVAASPRFLCLWAALNALHAVLRVSMSALATASSQHARNCEDSIT